jgi:hypothetical protein
MKAVLDLIILGAGLWAIVRGGISLLVPNISWELTQRRHAQRGISAERTEAWDAADRFADGVLIIAGFAILGLAVYPLIAVPT